MTNYICYWHQNGKSHAAILEKDEAMDVYRKLQPCLNLGIASWTNYKTKLKAGEKSEKRITWDE